MSIHKRDKRYVVRYREGSRNKSRTFDRLGDAEKFDLHQRHQRQLGLPVATVPKLTLEDWIAEWLVSKRDIEPETLEGYTRLLETHVIPFLGYLPLAHLDPRMMDRWQRQRLDAGAGATAIARTGTLLKSILAKAAKYDLISRNPALYERPRHTARVPVPATPEQIEGMRGYLLHGPRAEQTDQHRIHGATGASAGVQGEAGQRPSHAPASAPLAAWVPRQGDALLISLLGYVGLRPGEALALEWSDLRGNGISITKANRDGRIKSTKTGKSRLAPVPAPVRKELVEWQIASQGSLVFGRRSDGGLWTRSNYDHWRTRVFAHARDAAGLLEAFTPYHLRHTAASLMLAANVSVVEVAERLGHSPATCLQTYAHVITEFREQEPVSVERRIEKARAA